MDKMKCTLNVLAAFLFIMTCATAGQAQAQRTFVAGPGIGLDTNNTVGQGYCSFSNPCRNFSVAYGVTNTGGEIIALSPGVGYGGLTITHAITVTGLPGQVAFVAVGAGSTGFVVSAGATDQVVIRNISFNGQNAGTNTGLSHTSGKLVVENCNFTQLTTGVTITNARANLDFCNFVGNTTGVKTTGQGADDQNCPPCGGTTAAIFEGGSLLNNGTALQAVDPDFRPAMSSDNRKPFLFHNVGGTWTTNAIGNATLTSGSGLGCTGGCVTLTLNYQSGANPH
jgi:hypothetical protein